MLKMAVQMGQLLDQPAGDWDGRVMLRSAAGDRDD
jgi:hypothetical protein